MSVEDATAKILLDYKHEVEDPDQGMSFWSGLALTQFQLGRLQPEVRDRTIQLIDAGGDLALWAETGPIGPRKAALEKLRAQLLGPQKSPVVVRPPRKIFSPVEAGQTVAWKLPDGREAYLKVVETKTWRRGSYPILEIVDSHGRPYLQKTAFRDGRREPALYAVLEGRVTHLPKAEDLRLVQRSETKSVPNPRSYTAWRGLATICSQLLDDPDARPKIGLRRFFN